MGDSGCPHDFILAYMLQRTFNATSDVNKSDSHSVTFQKNCAQLSDDLFVYTNKPR